MILRSLSSCCLTVALLSASGRAEPETFAAARSVLGQPAFDTEDPGTVPSAATLTMPEGVAVDPVSGKVFVADSSSHRILRYSATDAYQTGAAAEAVLGQEDFESVQANRGGTPTAATLNYPAMLAFEPNGRLWVTDYENYRVLYYDNAADKVDGADADGVLGQPDFITATQADAMSEHSSFSGPYGIAADEAGNVWVSDYELDRVLVFLNAAAKMDGADADGVFGQPDLGTYNLDTTTQSSFNGPSGLSIGDGCLWVADQGNQRILRFDDAANLGDGAPADGVFGQGDFTTGTQGPDPTAARFNNPYYVTAAPNGTVWVSDYTYVRVLGFRDAKTKSGLVDADVVLGHATFTEAPHRPADIRSLRGPAQVAVGREGSLFVVVYDQSRVVRFSDKVTISPLKRKILTTKPKATIRGNSTGASRVEFRVSGQGGYRSAIGTTSWTAKAKKLTRRVTRVNVRATAFDGVSASSTVKVKAKKKK